MSSDIVIARVLCRQPFVGQIGSGQTSGILSLTFFQSSPPGDAPRARDAADVTTWAGVPTVH